VRYCTKRLYEYIEHWPNPITTSAGLAGEEILFQWIGVVENIPCYGAPTEHWDLLPARWLASRKILSEQNIQIRTGPAL
jgi:hypothetical protein